MIFGTKFDLHATRLKKPENRLWLTVGIVGDLFGLAPGHGGADKLVYLALAPMAAASRYAMSRALQSHMNLWFLRSMHARLYADKYVHAQEK